MTAPTLLLQKQMTEVEEPHLLSVHLRNKEISSSTPSKASSSVKIKPPLVRHHDEPPKPDWSFLEQGVLFGRDEEIEVLQDAFWRRKLSSEQNPEALSQPELILVSGKSGTGKSALVKKAYEKLVKEHHGYFAMGKFDQLQQQQSLTRSTAAEPYGPFIAALTQLAVAMEVEEQQQQQQHKTGSTTTSTRATLHPTAQRILDQVGMEYCQVLGSLVPALARLLRLPMPDEKAAGSAQLSSTQQDAQQDRLKVALTKLFQAIPVPVILVMDDLQWADARSLDLIETLIDMRTMTTHRLMVVGICRSNEVPWHHTFAEMLRRLEDEKNTHILHVIVHNLTLDATTTMLAKVLQQSKELCIPVAKVIHEKSEGGNVFFVIQLLQALLSENVLQIQQKPCFGFNEEPEYSWHWDDQQWPNLLTSSHNNGSALDIVHLVSRKIQQLPESCQGLIMKMACIGAEVDYDILAIVVEGLDGDNVSLQEESIGNSNETNANIGSTQQLLDTAIQSRMIVEQLPHRPGRYAFVHDWIQQAAYSLIEEEGKPAEHIRIGRVLFEQLPSDEIDQYLFLVVNQLILGISLLVNEVDRIGVAELCVKAGQKATKQCDFVLAQDYFHIAVSLLPKRHWRDEYHLSLDLYCSKAKAECCAGRYDATDASLDEVIANCRTLNDGMPAQLIRINSLGIQNKLKEAIELGIQVMASLGEKFPTKRGILHLVPKFVKTKIKLQPLTDHDIYNLDTIDFYDTRVSTIMSILELLQSYCYFAGQSLFPFVILKSVKLTLKHGVCPMSCMALASYGLLLCAAGDTEEGVRYANLALRLLERFPQSTTHVVPMLYCVCYGIVLPWKNSVFDSINSMEYAINMALDTGNTEWAASINSTMVTCAFVAGETLPVLDKRISKSLKIMSDECTWHPYAVLQRHFVDKLVGRPNKIPLVAVEMNSTRKSNEEDVQLYQCSLASVLMRLDYHLGDVKGALGHSVICQKYMQKMVASPYLTLIYVYAGMTSLAVAYDSKGIQRRRHLAWARQILKKLKGMRKKSPELIMHKMLLLQGEYHSVTGSLPKSMECFAVAIDSAARAGMTPLCALAHERAAMACLRHGNSKQDADWTRKHMKLAIEAYSRWGATALATYLKTKHEVLVRDS